ERGWNDGHTEHAANDVGDGEADSVDGDGAFVYQVGVESVRDANAQPPVVFAERIQGEEFAGAIDVDLHDVAVHPAAGGERAFQVDARAGAQIARVAAVERLRGEVGGEAIGAQSGDGETDAVDGDTGAHGGIAQAGGTADGETRSGAGSCGGSCGVSCGNYGAELLNNSGEHQGILRRRIRRVEWDGWSCGGCEWRRSGGGVRCRRRGGGVPGRPEFWGRSRRRCDPPRQIPGRSS